MKSIMKNKLNLGCGTDIRSDMVNLDFYGDCDIQHDLNKTPYPFKKNQFELIYASHIIEHLDSPHKIIRELFRITKQGGTIIIRVPHSTSYSAFSPHHKTFWNNIGDLKKSKDYQLKSMFEGFEVTSKTLFWTKMTTIFWNSNRLLFHIWNTRLRWIFPAKEIIIKLHKR